MSQRIFVTGATGYIARHIVAQLLNAGHSVTGSSRSVGRDSEVRQALVTALDHPGSLEHYRTVALDLTEDRGWTEEMAGHDVLIHTASPFPFTQPKHADDVIRPAVDGTRRALTAAIDAGIERVVLTSSTVAITGNGDKDLYTEGDWTDPSAPGVTPYAQSKILAEHAAWAFARTHESLNLAVINPSFVQGPPLGDTNCTSVRLIDRLRRGSDPMLPNLGFGTCDVRDVALAHVRAMDTDGAFGHRHAICDRFLWFKDLSRLIRDADPRARPARIVAPDFLIRAMALIDPSVRSILPQLGKVWPLDTTRMTEVLGIAPRNACDSVREMARWLSARD